MVVVRRIFVCGIDPPSSGISLRLKKELRRELFPLAGFAMSDALGEMQSGLVLLLHVLS